MSTRFAFYVIGIPLLALFIFVQITGLTFIIWTLFFVGLIGFISALIFIIRPSDQTAYDQYVQKHNEQAAILQRHQDAMLRAQVIQEESEETALIDESDD